MAQWKECAPGDDSDRLLHCARRDRRRVQEPVREAAADAGSVRASPYGADGARPRRALAVAPLVLPHVERRDPRAPEQFSTPRANAARSTLDGRRRDAEGSRAARRLRFDGSFAQTTRAAEEVRHEARARHETPRGMRHEARARHEAW